MIESFYSLLLLFCRHKGTLEFRYNLHGDIIFTVSARSVWRCLRCGKYVYLPGLYTEQGKPIAVKIDSQFDEKQIDEGK